MANELFRTSVMLPNGKRKWIRSKSKEGLEQKKKEVIHKLSNHRQRGSEDLCGCQGYSHTPNASGHAEGA